MLYETGGRNKCLLEKKNDPRKLKQKPRALMKRRNLQTKRFHRATPPLTETILWLFHICGRLSRFAPSSNLSSASTTDIMREGDKSMFHRSTSCTQ